MGLVVLHILPSFITIWLCALGLVTTISMMQILGLGATLGIAYLIFIWLEMSAANKENTGDQHDTRR